jgi:hypothetical protein
MNYVIGTGWWCDGTGKHVDRNETSSNEARHLEFFDMWYDKVQKFTSPDKVVIVNSDSPIKPNFSDYINVTTIDLDKNFNGAGILQGARKKFHSSTGVNVSRTAGTRQVFMSAWYAYYNDFDYYVWLEQDCLVYGDVIEPSIKNLESKKADYSLGLWNHNYKLETALIIQS